jgi:hypothetical protein
MEYCFNKVGDLLLKRGIKGIKRFQLGHTKFYYNYKCSGGKHFHSFNDKTIKNYLFIMEYLNQYNPMRFEGMTKEFKENKKEYKIKKGKIKGISDYYFKLKVEKCKHYDCIVLPVGFEVYKGMDKTKYKLNNIENPFSQGVGWFGPKEVAMPYAEEKNGEVYKYKTIRPLKLFILGNKHNLMKLHNLIIERIQNHLDKEFVNKKSIKKHIDDLLALRLATGLLIDYEEQKKLIKKLYNKELSNKKITKIRFNIDGEIYSPLSMDLNRESFRRLDHDLINTICSTLGFDGYINYNVPSIGAMEQWGIDYMTEEIGLCHQKGSLTEV